MSKGYIKSLDGMRALAILLVMTYHADITHFGWVGVQLFFVLSGFLITSILWKEKDQTTSIIFKLKRFWVRRSLRIFPLYFAYLGVITISYLLFHFPSYLSMYFPYLVSYTFNFSRLLPNWVGSPLFAHLWSLCVEEQFYIFFPLLIFLLPKNIIKYLLIAGILFSPAFRFFLTEHYLKMNLTNTVVVHAVNFHTLSHLDAFFIGGAIPVFSLHNKFKRPGILLLFVTLFAIAIGIFSFLQSGSKGNYLLDLGFNQWLLNLSQPTWLYSCVNIFSTAAIIFLTAPTSLGKTASIIRRFLESNWLVSIGKVSYGMYIFHWLIFVYVFNKIYMPETISMKLLMFLPYVVVVYLVSQLSYNLLEVYFIKLKDKFFTGKVKAA